MNDCRRFEELIEKLMVDEIVNGDLTLLREHCTSCKECNSLLELHGGLQDLGQALPEPSTSELAEIRQRVLAQTARSPRQQSVQSSGFITDLGALFRNHPSAAILAAAAMIVFAIFMTNRPPVEPHFDDELLQAINSQAERMTGLDDYWDAPFVFTNVTVRQQDNGRFALSFDANRHFDLSTSQDSPLAREVLMHAIMEPTSMGSRFQAMAMAPQIMDPRLREALIFTMHQDPSLAVRLNSLTVLSSFPDDEIIQEALLQTLKQDKEVQMRLLAMEHLTDRQVAFETLQQAVTDGGFDADAALLQRTTEKNLEF
ncbi:MAG: hypothetical protein GY835_07750 [bacterium]|nr:hypothetical protein [bacterium]